MRYLRFALYGLGLMILASIPANAQGKDLVVVLHGIGQSKWNMVGVELALKQANYDVLNIDYPSLDKGITDLSGFVGDELTKRNIWKSDYNNIHFVTHSMGGLVLDGYLKANKKTIPSEKLGRVVMLAPPHGGSEVADLLHELKLYQWIYGPAGQDLTTENRKDIKGKVFYDLGIIAGNKKWPYVVAAHVIPDDNDGRVAVEKTKLDGMSDHIELSATHSFIAWKPATYQQITYFLKNGKFNHVK